jgi:multisubunit Na+/H+ antiporter MnhG subunit
MSAQTSGFRAGCREQAGLAIVAFGRLWSRYAPGGRNRILLRAGCLIFAPFITLFVWMVQGMIWVAISAPILAYALLMAALGSGFSRATR